MSTIRVYELAKELGTNSKDLIHFLKSEGVFCRSASSVLEPETASHVRERFRTAPDVETGASDSKPVDNTAHQLTGTFTVAPAFNLTSPDVPYETWHQLALIERVWFEVLADSEADAVQQCQTLWTQGAPDARGQKWPVGVRGLAQGDLLAAQGRDGHFRWYTPEATRVHRGRSPLHLTTDDPRLSATHGVRSAHIPQDGPQPGRQPLGTYEVLPCFNLTRTSGSPESPTTSPKWTVSSSASQPRGSSRPSRARGTSTTLVTSTATARLGLPTCAH